MIASILSPDCIERRKNAESSERSDEKEMEEEVEEDKEVDANELLEVLQSSENITVNILHKKPPRESNTISVKQILS